MRNSESSWRDTRKQLRKDHRWELASLLEREEKEKLFEVHLENLTKKNREMFHKLLDETPEVSTGKHCWQEMSRLVEKPTMWFPKRSDTNWPVQAQKQARGLKFWLEVEEELYYPSGENKGADQLRGYREADLRLCFRLCRLLVFP